MLAMCDKSFTLIWLLIGIEGCEVYARLMRGATLQARLSGYVTAVCALGATSALIYLGHVLPNIVNIVLVSFTVNLPLTVLLETALSFLGLGVQRLLISLGRIMSAGRDRLMTAWWLTLLPGAIIFCPALLVSMIGDRLRDWLDPTLPSE